MKSAVKHIDSLYTLDNMVDSGSSGCDTSTKFSVVWVILIAWDHKKHRAN